MTKLFVRHYRQDDRGMVRQIAWDTAFLGKQAAAFLKAKNY